MAGRFSAKANALADAVIAVADAALDHATDEIVAEQKRLAPKNTGALAASIRKEKRGPLSYVIKAGGSLTTREARAGSGKAYDYAMGQEFGNHHSPAQPFFFPGYRIGKKAAKREVRNAIKQAIKTAAAT